MPTAAATMYAQPGRSSEATTGLSEIDPKIAAFVPSRMSAGLRKMMNRARSWVARFPTSATMIGGMMKTAMIAAVAYARRGVQAAISPDTPAEQARRRAPPWSEEPRDRADLVADSPSTGSVATKTRPTNRMMYGARSTEEEGQDEAADLGQRVVGPGQDAREVQRQDAVALVAPEQLGCLRARRTA